MPTFYKGGTESLFWLGSIAWDGYPGGLPEELLESTDEATWVRRVEAFVSAREDGTHAEQGWPWPWPNSCTTDYAYAWTPEGVKVAQFGRGWYALGEDPPEQLVAFPDMSAIQNMAAPGDNRSGVIVFGLREPE